MNKKQLIIAWITGIIICLICLHPPTYRPYHDRIDIVKTIQYVIPILIIGILLIFTLRNDDVVKQVKKIFTKIKEFFRVNSRSIYQLVNGIGIIGLFLLIFFFALYGTFEGFPLKLTLCYLIYLIVKVWAIRKQVDYRRIDKRFCVKQGLLILGCLILMGISTLFLRFNKPHYDFDVDSGIPITDDGKLAILDSAWNDYRKFDIENVERHNRGNFDPATAIPIGRFFGKDMTGMSGSQRQVAAEVNKIINNNARKEKIIRFWRKIFSILWITGLFFYPAYVLIKLIRWEIMTLRKK